jgi:hypothetical protein
MGNKSGKHTMEVTPEEKKMIEELRNKKGPAVRIYKCSECSARTQAEEDKLVHAVQTGQPYIEIAKNPCQKCQRALRQQLVGYSQTEINGKIIRQPIRNFERGDA